MQLTSSLRLCLLCTYVLWNRKSYIKKLFWISLMEANFSLPFPSASIPWDTHQLYMEEERKKKRKSNLCEKTLISALLSRVEAFPWMSDELPHPIRWTSSPSYLSESLLASCGKQMGLTNCKKFVNIVCHCIHNNIQSDFSFATKAATCRKGCPISF